MRAGEQGKINCIKKSKETRRWVVFLLEYPVALDPGSVLYEMFQWVALHCTVQFFQAS